MASLATVSPVNEVIELLARAPSREETAAFRLSPSAREHIRGLLDRNSQGLLTVDEQRELDQAVLLDDILSLIRVRAQGNPTATAGA